MSQLRKKIPPRIRQAVYDKYEGHCAYCGTKFESIRDMQVDHIDSVYRAEYEGRAVDDSLDNYMPACRACNFYKSTSTLEEFRNKLATLHIRLEKQFIYRIARQYGMVTENEVPNFYFEKYLMNQRMYARMD